MYLKTILHGSTAAFALFATSQAIAEPGKDIAVHDNRTAEASPETDPKQDSIIVTGQRERRTFGAGALGDKTVLDTPFSISTIKADDIAKRQASSIGQIFINDPGIYSNTAGATTSWWGTKIRGLEVRNHFIDDVPLMLYWGGDFPVEGIEQVQALKGLTGFMHGFGSPGGAFSYRSKQPTTETMATAQIGYRNNSLFKAHLDASGPLAEERRLGYRLNIAGEKGTAYNQSKVNRWVASLGLRSPLSTDVEWFANATYEANNLEREPFHIYWNRYKNKALPAPTYDYAKLNVDNSFYKTNTFLAMTGIEWKILPQWSLRATYGFGTKKHLSNKTFAYLLNEQGDYQGYMYNFAQVSKSHALQLLLQGHVGSEDLMHNLVAGVSYRDNRADFGGKSSRWANDFNGNIYRPQPFRVTRSLDLNTDGIPHHESQKALFLSDTLHIGKAVQLVAGARYTHYKIHAQPQAIIKVNGYETTAITPTFAAIYKPVEYASFYASYVESLEAGKRVSGHFANAGDLLKPARSHQYELGAKYEREPFNLSAAAFYVSRVNEMETENGQGQRFLTQDGLTLYKGIEFNACYRPNDAFTIGGGVVYLDPRIDKVSKDKAALLGNIPSEVSRWQGVTYAEYRIPGTYGLSTHGNVRYAGKAPTSNSNQLFMPAHTTVSAGFQYNTVLGSQRLLITGNINNLFNSRYWDVSNFGEARNAALDVKLFW